MAGSLTWERVGEHFFRTLEGPAMCWKIRIGQVNVRAGPCCGVIAVWDNYDIIVRRDANFSAKKPLLCLYSSEGTNIGQIKLDFGLVKEVLITINETVIVITRSGLIRHFTDFGKNFVQVQLPASIEKASLFYDGYTAQLVSPEGNSRLLRFATVTKINTSEPKYRIANLETNSDFVLHSWCMLPENLDIGQAPGIILVDESGTLHIYDVELTSSSHRIHSEKVPVGFVKGSPDESNVAFSDGKKHVVVYPVDFHEKLYETTEARPHSDIFWVGKDALALTVGDGEADVLSLKQSSAGSPPLTTYFDDSEVALIQEVDGVRILGRNNHALLLPVSRPTVDTFKLGSLAPSSILYSCVDQIESGSPRSDQTIKLLDQNQLTRAVDTCISSALLEIDPKIQKRLMRAASFGKLMIEVYDSSRYLTTLSKLRILNALRSLAKEPLFITNDQLESLGISSLLQRLSLRHLWAEAVSVAKLEHIPIEPVYIEWACWLIQNRDESSDEELRAELDLKLCKLGAFSHSKMALRAIEQGRQKLALGLLEDEPVSSDRVALLLEMSMVQPALEQAIKSGNVYLVDYVLIIIAEKLSFSQLMRVIGGNMIAIDHQIQLLRINTKAKDTLHDFLYQMDQRLKSLQIELDDARSEPNLLIKTRQLRASENKFGSLSKKYLPDSRACGEWADLVNLQSQLETSYNIQVVGKSAADTITALLKLPQVSQAQKVKSKLGISDRQFWWLRIRAFVDRRDFDSLWEFAQSKKSPIGYRPFYDACLESGNLEYASRFVEMISEASVEDKVRMYLKAKKLEKAKELALKSRNPQIVNLVS